jgi:hypothetical protein
MYLDAQAQLRAPPKNVAKRRVKPTVTKKAPRKRKQTKLVPNLTPQEETFFGCKNTLQGFRTTSFGNHNAFATGPIRIMCSPLADRRFSYKASIEITHGLSGKPIKTHIPLPTPTLRTSRDKLDVAELLGVTLMKMAFSVYVRVMARMRKNLFLPEAAVDSELAFDPGYAVIDAQLPERVSETFFPLERNVSDTVKSVCRANRIDYVDPAFFGGESTSSSGFSQ